jgi:hypothetical protein
VGDIFRGIREGLSELHLALFAASHGLLEGYVRVPEFLLSFALPDQAAGSGCSAYGCTDVVLGVGGEIGYALVGAKGIQDADSSLLDSVIDFESVGGVDFGVLHDLRHHGVDDFFFSPAMLKRQERLLQGVEVLAF